MNASLVAANARGWNLIGHATKVGVSLTDALNLAEAECEVPGLKPLFRETIHKLHALQGAPLPDPWCPELIPATASALCYVGFVTGLLDRSLIQAAQILERRLNQSQAPLPQRLFWDFIDLLDSGLNIGTILNVLARDWGSDEPQVKEAFRRCEAVVSEGRSLADAINTESSLFPKGAEEAVRTFESSGGNSESFRAYRAPVLPAKDAVRGTPAAFYENWARGLDDGVGLIPALDAAWSELAAGAFKGAWFEVLGKMKASGEEQLLADSRISQKERLFLQAGYYSGDLANVLRVLRDVA